jgi:formylmethanofuran dehydrogenase subunit B
MTTTIDNVTSAACGLVCEEITLRIDKQRIVEVNNACPLCTARLKGRSLDEGPQFKVKGHDVSQVVAIERAAEILADAKSPLIYGLAGSTVETQRAAVALADLLGATIDPAIPTFHRDAIVALQSVGISTCTLGEIKQRADVVVLWGAEPDKTHPRLFERFLHPPGTFFPGKRRFISIKSSFKQNVDLTFNIDQKNMLAAIVALRAIVTGIEIEPKSVAGIDVDQLKQFAEWLQEANYSAILFGPGIGGQAEIESLFLLVRQLNNRSRCVTMGLGGPQIENVLTWQTGYPCGVNFALGYPRYDPYAFSANVLLEREEVDAILIVGSQSIESLSPVARTKLSQLPSILLDDAGQAAVFAPTAQIATALSGVHTGGTVFRMDGVPLKLRAICDSGLPTAASILSAIQQGVGSSCV